MKKLFCFAIACFLSLIPYASADPVYGYFRQIAGFLRSSYINPSRFNDPGPMLNGALRALENKADAIMVEEEEGPEGTKYTVLLEKESWPVPGQDVGGKESSPGKNLKELAKVLEGAMMFVEENYEGDTEEIDNLRYAMANGMTSALDPHTNVFTPKEYKEFFVHIEGEICGIGAYIGVRNGKLKIISPLDGTPADKAGLKANDTVVSVDGESTVGMTTQEAVSLIRGEEASEVVLLIRRKGHNKLLKKEITRRKVSIPSVKSQLLEGGIGYIKVVNFAENTSISFLRHLRRLRRENGRNLSGIVLDLRNNPGGLLKQAVALANVFLTEGDIVFTAHKGRILGSASAEDAKGFEEPECPLVVLVNHGSASGSEILAGALRKNDRALLMGYRTFGKGSVQQPRPLSDDSCLKLTVYEYLLPGKASIQNVGVTPDILLHAAVVEEDEIRVFAEDTTISERLHKQAITSPFAKKEEPAWRIIYNLDLPDEEQDADESARSFVKGEFDLEGPAFVAVHLARKLIGLTKEDKEFDTAGFLTANKEAIRELKREEFRKVVKRLGEAGMNWKKGPVPEDPEVELTLDYEIKTGTAELEENGEGEGERKGQAEELDPTPQREVVLNAELKNLGKEDLWRVDGLVETSDIGSPYLNREFLFGHVPAGKSVTRRIKVPIAYFSIPREDRFKVVLKCGEDYKLAEEEFSVKIPNGAMPRLAGFVQLLNSGGEEATCLVPGREFSFRVRVKNVGQVESFKTVVRLRNESEPSKAVYIVKGREVFTNMKPGDEEVCDFSFKVKEAPETGKYNFRFDVFEVTSVKGISKDFTVWAPGGNDFTSMELEPPVVAVKAKELVTEKSEIKIQSEIEDDRSLQYFMVFSEARDREHVDTYRDKVFFRSVKGKKGPLVFKPGIPLKKGANLVTVVATDSQELRTVRSVLVQRTGG